MSPVLGVLFLKSFVAVYFSLQLILSWFVLTVEVEFLPVDAHLVGAVL